MILSHIDCFIQGEVIGFQVLLDSLHPRSMIASWWSPPLFKGKLLRSSWHLFRLAFVHCGLTGRNAMIGCFSNYAMYYFSYFAIVTVMYSYLLYCV